MSERETRADVLDALRSCRLWRSAPDEAVTELAAHARVSDVPRGTMLATEGEVASEFGVVVAGRARVFYLGPDGKRITFETLDAGDPVAAIAALAGGRHPANIDTVTPATIAWLKRERLLDLMAAEPAVAHDLVADLARRTVNFTSVVQTLALDVPSRLARYIFQRSLSVGQPTSRGLEVDLGMPKGELAAALGTVPETLSRAFATLRDEHILEVHGRTVTVFDVRAIAHLGSGWDA